jgi:hypothetical protein
VPAATATPPTITARTCPLGSCPLVYLQAGQQGLILLARLDEVALRWHQPGHWKARVTGVPAELLDRFERAGNGTFSLEPVSPPRPVSTGNQPRDRRLRQGAGRIPRGPPGECLWSAGRGHQANPGTGAAPAARAGSAPLRHIWEAKSATDREAWKFHVLRREAETALSSKP